MDSSLAIDALLVAGFGVQHSILATVRVKARARSTTGITPLAWRSAESLSNVTYILAAASLWRTSDTVVWATSGVASLALSLVFVVSWVWYWQLHLVEYDCGLAFGSTTLVAQLSGKPQYRLTPWKVGSRRWIRFPVHTAFFGMFFALPVMTADLFVLAVFLNLYNIVGSILYDKRLAHLSGDSYREYTDRTGLIFPPVYRCPAGAGDIVMERPVHWRRPTRHLPGVLAGLLLGAAYFFALSSPSLSARDMTFTALVGLVGSLLVGLPLGRVCKPDRSVDWNQQQTDLSTTVATAAAVGVASYALAVALVQGNPPTFAVYLPLWFIVQYLGHVTAVLADRRKWLPRELVSTAAVPAQAPARDKRGVVAS